MRRTSGKPDIVAKVEGFLDRLGASRTLPIVVAVSGGADSTALLSVLHECRRFSLKLVAVHVDHGMRSRSEHQRDIDFLTQLAGRMGVELCVERVGEGVITERAAAEKRSLEDVAREIRYSLLSAVAAKNGDAWIATAHTLDDQMETVLMRLFQGGLLAGLAGIPARRGRIIRPLLGCSRREVADYLSSRNLTYRLDLSNNDKRFLRNRIRKELLPAVKDIFPASAASVEMFTRQIAEINELLDASLSALIPWEKEGSDYVVAAAAFFSVPGELRVRSLLRLFNAEGTTGRIPRRFLRAIETAESGVKRKLLVRGNGMFLEQLGETLFWRPRVVLRSKKSYLIHVFEPNMYHISPTLCFTVSAVPSGQAGGKTIRLPESLIRHPLVVRSRMPGDAIRMKYGQKSLKKLYNEWGVAQSHRDELPVIEDRTGIWAVGGGAFGYENRRRDCSNMSDAAGVSGREIVFAFERCGDQP